MALVLNQRELYQHAVSHEYIIPAFNCFDIESMRAIVMAAEEEDSPVVLQVCMAMHNKVHPLGKFVSYIKDYLADAEAPVLLNHDHMQKIEDCMEAVDMGFPSVMFDGSHLLFEENVEKARELLSQAGYPDGKGFPVLTYKYPSLELDADTAQVIQEQLKQNLNIEIKLEAQELQTNYATRRAGNFDLCRMNWTADFADPYTYLSMLLSNGTYNCSGVRDEKYDRLVEASDVETDPVKRNALLHEAEQWAVGEQFYIIPLFSMKSCNLIRPDITGVSQIPATGALEYRYADVKGD